MSCVYVNPRWIRSRPTALFDVAALVAGWIGENNAGKPGPLTDRTRADIAASTVRPDGKTDWQIAA